MKKRGKKLLSYLLALVLVMGLMPWISLTAKAESTDPKPETITVTFVVENGSWDDGTTENKTKTIVKGQSLQNNDIPNVGSKPAAGYTTDGHWYPDPSRSSTFPTDTSCIYTYTAKAEDETSTSSDVGAGGSGDAPVQDTWWTVAITGGWGMTTFGETFQTVENGHAMTNVVYTAADGYYFPTNYSVTTDKGVSAAYTTAKTITVSGTPTANVEITLVAATPKATQTITAPDTLNPSYGDTDVSINASVTVGDGALSYAVTGGSDVIAVDSAGNITTKKVGTATVTVTAAETENYKEATKDVTVNVTQAPPTADNYDFTPAPTDPTDPTEPTEPEKNIDMYRLYNPNSGEHFYTGNEEEKDGLVALGWNFEGIAWTAPAKSNTPVYRLYNPNAGDHHYTMSEAEKDWLVGLGWNDEGIGWYSVVTERLPIYRLYNPNATTGTHHFTASEGERDYLISLGWRDEKIGWYGLGEDAA